MNMQNFTISASTRIQEAQDAANNSQNPQIHPLHLLESMLKAEDSITKDILIDL
jgi:ATP-dependent Clp protease ATP-binding subunit ClpA